MKNPEEAIGKVLAGLRDVDAPVGMEGRILGSLEEKASVRSGLGWRMLLGVPVSTRYVVCGVAVAGLLAVGLAIPAIRRFGHAPAQAKLTMAPAKPSTTTAPNAEFPASHVQDSVAAARGLGRRFADREEPIAPEIEAALSSDEIAVSEMLAPSHPAPPMPLTDEERLLMRLVRKRDPVELALLGPQVGALKDLEERTEFQQFFVKPALAPPTIEDLTIKEQAAPAAAEREQTPSAQAQPDPSKLEHTTTGEKQ